MEARPVPSLSESAGWKIHNFFSPLFFILACYGITLHAQMPEGLITGRVRDAASLQDLAEVQVSLIGSSGDELVSTVTNSLGEYRFLAVKPGQYQLKFQKPGYPIYLFKDLLSQSARTSLVDLQMRKNSTEGPN